VCDESDGSTLATAVRALLVTDGMIGGLLGRMLAGRSVGLAGTGVLLVGPASLCV
jgi:hypothetical protein